MRKVAGSTCRGNNALHVEGRPIHSLDFSSFVTVCSACVRASFQLMKSCDTVSTWVWM